ncbi:SDR family NAD(P)-dependent oxidoreductase [Sphingomonas montanisoli]|uniref:SDR family NAD(P)-dependent oxidoreductase n=1 Tax=Sphingomonas montanisoli TaxID=2606412 RepID=A0A5D9BZ75_9SPHN|nr:SDR family NAD(P)-dependent oxidoreductase [Sphingomonas montanisoli]TZG24724.1 SDR family NAD(P)-dependent oxidoreductase [Sphingomonas montanisoli]
MTDFTERYGEWALVLGASEGLGRAIAAQAAAHGMKVAMVARRPELLRMAAEDIAAEYGVETRAIAADCGDPHIVETIEAALHDVAIGLMIYNCAAEPHGTFLDQDIAEHHYNIAVNCTGPSLLVHHFGRQMVARGRGGIVLCSSLAAEQGIYSYVSYGAAKAYEMILGEGLWDELADHGVDAATLMVGSTYTPNFIKQQRKKGTLFAETRTPANLPEGVPVPQTPEDAASHLFRQMAGQWLPRFFANPRDEVRAGEMKAMSRVELVKRMGDAMRSGYRAMAQ